mgnify:CR=1 FL=1
MSKFKKSLIPITTYVPIDIKRLFRDKMAIFFVFIFPLIFLVIFGSIFRGDSDVSFRIGLLNESQSEFAKDFAAKMNENDVFKIDEAVTNMDQARQKMNRGQLDATVVLSEGFGHVQTGNSYPSGEVKILYDQNNESAGTTLASVMDGIFKEINSNLVPTVTPSTVKAESSATKG